MKGTSSPDTVSVIVLNPRHVAAVCYLPAPCAQKQEICRFLAYERLLTPGFVSTTILHEFDFSVCRSV